MMKAREYKRVVELPSSMTKRTPQSCEGDNRQLNSSQLKNVMAVIFFKRPIWEFSGLLMVESWLNHQGRDKREIHNRVNYDYHMQINENTATV